MATFNVRLTYHEGGDDETKLPETIVETTIEAPTLEEAMELAQVQYGRSDPGYLLNVRHAL